MTDASPVVPHATHSGNRVTLVRASRMSLLVAAVIVLLDQISKAWALGALSDGRIIHVIRVVLESVRLLV